jgi:hypothetical protein
MTDLMRSVVAVDSAPVFDTLLAAATHEPTSEGRLRGITRRVLLSMLEQGRTREPITYLRR